MCVASQEFQTRQSTSVSTTEHGKRAEKATGNYLQEHGYKVREYNWRTRYCEIDIVAEKAGIIYFVEVKYRSHDRQGSGLEYITSSKLKQMGLAAELWVQAHEWSGDYCLAAAEVAGADYQVGVFTSDL